jgi:CHASE2 domain-containing sensor protein
MKPKRTTRTVTTIIVLLLIGVTLIPEYGSEILEATGAKSRGAWSRVFEGAFWYQPLLKAGNRTPRNRFVRIATLGDQREPGELFANICKQRIFMSRLIQKLQSAGPSVIVIDKYFSPDSCPDPSDPGNRMLRDVISTSQIPIVLGIHTLDREHLKLRPPISKLEEDHLKVAGLVVSPLLRFTNPLGLVSYGLIRLNHDNRKIPLEWQVYASRSELSSPQGRPISMPTLSLLAAEQVDPSLSSEAKIKDLLARREHPYTGFLSEKEIPTFSALDLLCGPQFPTSSDWQLCEPSDYQNRTIRNHVIVVGNSTDDSDIDASVIGNVPGVVLQANYIESLLDDRFLKPVPGWWNLGINLSMVFVIGFLFLATSRQKHPVFSPDRLAVASLFIALFLWIVSYLVAVHVGYYLSIWFPGLYVLALWAHSHLDDLKKENEADAALQPAAAPIARGASLAQSAPVAQAAPISQSASGTPGAPSAATGIAVVPENGNKSEGIVKPTGVEEPDAKEVKRA